MIETAANLVWQAMEIVSAGFLVYGAGVCACHLLVPAGLMRRALTRLGRGFREASIRCEHLAYRQF